MFLKTLRRVSLAMAATALLATSAFAAGTLRIGMTASDIPLTTGQTDQGGEGMRFMGYTVYDALINWDLSQRRQAVEADPGARHRMECRPGRPHQVDLQAAAGREVSRRQRLQRRCGRLEPRQAPERQERAVRLPPGGTGRKPHPRGQELPRRRSDDRRDHHQGAGCDAALPDRLDPLFVSPANWEAQGKDWTRSPNIPPGTGPWMLESFVPRERAVLVPFKDYWDKDRVPKLDKLVLLPLPEPNARSAALMSGQVDWIEAPAPDARSGHQGVPGSRSCRTPIRITGPGTSRGWTARPGTTSACGRPPISRSTATG